VLTSNSAASICNPFLLCDCVNSGVVPKQCHIIQADADHAAKINRTIRSITKKAATRG
jgi:hypothetical protein